MLQFRVPQLHDRDWVDSFFLPAGKRGCEYTFTNLYAWQIPFSEEIAACEGYLTIRFAGDRYCYPAGQGDIRPMLCAMAQDAETHGHALTMYGLTESDCAALEALYPDCFTFEALRDTFDYCYSIDKLTTLSGKKLHGKRNHIHRFEERFPDWQAEELTEALVPECLALNEDWVAHERETGNEDENSIHGTEALIRCITHFRELGLEGLCLRAGGRLVAFTMGKSIGGDTYDVFFEKAYADVQGAYPMINREFARWVKAHHPEIVYLNREDDMGEENLRKSKLSYYPDLLLAKHRAILKAGCRL